MHGFKRVDFGECCHICKLLESSVELDVRKKWHSFVELGHVEAGAVWQDMINTN